MLSGSLSARLFESLTSFVSASFRLFAVWADPRSPFRFSSRSITIFLPFLNTAADWVCAEQRFGTSVKGISDPGSERHADLAFTVEPTRQ